jgi:hypothetical protein
MVFDYENDLTSDEVKTEDELDYEGDLISAEEIKRLEESEVIEKEDNYPFEITRDIYIYSEFDNTIIEIGYVFLATGEQNVVKYSGGKINLLHGRMYYIPVDNKAVNSDDFIIKTHKEASDRFDVRFVVDGLAAIVPIRHNAILRSNEKLCVLCPR